MVEPREGMQQSAAASRTEERSRPMGSGRNASRLEPYIAVPPLKRRRVGSHLSDAPPSIPYTSQHVVSSSTGAVDARPRVPPPGAGGSTAQPYYRIEPSSPSNASLSTIAPLSRRYPRTQTKQNNSAASHPVFNIKSEPSEPQLPAQPPHLVRRGAYRARLPGHPISDRKAWYREQVKFLQRQADVDISIVLEGSSKILPDGAIINWTTDVDVMIDAQGIPRLPPQQPANMLADSAALLDTRTSSSLPAQEADSENTVPPLSVQSSPPNSSSQHSTAPHEGPSVQAYPYQPRVHASGAPTPGPSSLPARNEPVRSSSASSSTPALSIDESSRSGPSPPIPTPSSPPLSLFELHKQQRLAKLNAQTRPAPGVGAAAFPAGPVTLPHGDIAVPVERAEPGSDDDMYMTWDEYDRLSKSVEPRTPVQRPRRPGVRDDVHESASVDHSAHVENTAEAALTRNKVQEMELLAERWLQDYIRAFDVDRSSLASAYSQKASFSYQQISHLKPAQPLSNTAPLHPPTRHVGTLDIIETLLQLPDTFSFSLDDYRVQYDLLVLFDIIVYGAAGEHAPDMMLVCYVDPAQCPSPPHGWRWVCEMQFILRLKEWDEEDRSVDGLWPLVAVSHQMTMRQIPADMPWKWQNRQQVL